MRCRSCGSDNPATNRFCGGCGAALASAAPVEATTAPDPGAVSDWPRAADGERRQLTVMFCDLVGSTKLSTQLDPEDLRDLLRSYQQTCAAAIAGHDGHVARLVGDGLLVYFGYPVGYEDAAHRAVRAGLDIIAEIQTLSESIKTRYGVELAVRIGIHSGLVVISEMRSGDHSDPAAVTGEAPNVAARIQGLAGANTVLISDATRHLVEGYFVLHAIGAHEMKGIAQAVPVYQVLGASGARSRLEIATAAGLTPLVGREEETERLVERWRRATGNGTETVLVTGEPGIGKSRQLQAIRERLAGEAHRVLECRCSPYHQNSSLHPIIELVRSELRLDGDDPAADASSRLASALAELGMDPVENVPILAALASLPLTAPYRAPDLAPPQLRQRTFEVIIECLDRIAASTPILFLVEDVHWVDPTTLELLEQLATRQSASPILVVLTARPEFRPPWPPGEHAIEIVLGRLPADETTVIAARVAGGRSLPPEILREVVGRTDGIPLFVEELTKMLLESGLVREGARGYEIAGPVRGLGIPSTLRDSLLARLDRLGSSKPVAQIAATLGRIFSFDLLQAVSGLAEPELARELDRLADAQFVLPVAAGRGSGYTFKHALMQEAAYDSLLRSTRQDYHRRAAEALVGRFPARAESEPEVVAHHYTMAGRTQDAVGYWQKAGQRAAGRSANQEAVAHFNRALELLRSLPESAENLQQELALEISLGPCLMAARGYAAPEVEAAYARARQICQAIGDTPQIVAVLFGLWAFYVVRGDLRIARDLGQQILRVCQGAGDSGLLLEAQIVLGVTLYFLGELPQAREHLEQAIDVYDPEQHRPHAMVFGQEPGMASHIYLAKTLWILGETDLAEQHRQTALSIAEATAHPHSSAFCLVYATLIEHFGGQPEATGELAKRTIALAEENSFPIWAAGARVLLGWALAETGRIEEGIGHMRRGIDAWKATGTNLYTPYWLGLLARAEKMAGRSREARERIDEASRLEEQGDEGVALAELHRLRGELLLEPGADSPERERARACFDRALAVARRQLAGSWERRADASLAALLGQRTR